MSDGVMVPAPAEGQGALIQRQPRGRLEPEARALVAGFAKANPKWDGVVVIPSDPSHWVHLSAGEVVSFQSFLTVRLASALGAEGAVPEMEQLGDTMVRPEKLAMHLRAAELGGNRDEILGALLGAEMAATKVFWLGQQVVVLGEGVWADSYVEALTKQGVPVARS
ncbi:2-dehydro-3-deoxygalactonokinase [Alisedimentitalea sp. MJ-SS2]|uniref:2-dehydro-3-deoxygalactonokinase n=1 Tax=Aliisedimentitalea sp. MJ-SS2 TaxID=3049795 RepID=UPI0029077BD4|nr:2-dehydro-3-deoxygalactonokinase [Alisedimentitalea sp. MJ-SS2]MDU8928038.1 2-dehydro-3-deoxygalactonokinase [Alisedimentitalea sp. MJ-SS2]